MNDRGQASIEVLIILGAAVVIAALIGLYLKGLVGEMIQPEIEGTTEEVVSEFD